MEWTADVAAGAWLRARIDNPWRGTMHDVVPHGFAAYARIFHPTVRERPIGRDWPGLPFAQHRAQWEAFQAAQPEIETRPVTWEATASAFGRTMHPLAQWGRLVEDGIVAVGEDSPRDTDGWRYLDPRQGLLAPDALSVLAAVLARHTTTPDAGFLALWEGWGGVTGGMGYGASRALLTAESPDPRHDAFLGHSTRDVFNDVFRRPSWQPGILSDEISRGPRLALPNRSYVLFRGGVIELADPAWVLDAPWRDRVAEEHGFPPEAESPSIVWPDDHAWAMVSEVDFDSTIIGGDPELVRELLRTDGLEVRQVREGADLGGDADDVNRPG